MGPLGNGTLLESLHQFVKISSPLVPALHVVSKWTSLLSKTKEWILCVEMAPANSSFFRLVLKVLMAFVSFILLAVPSPSSASLTITPYYYPWRSGLHMLIIKIATFLRN